MTMPEPPETLFLTVTPAKVLERFELIRDQYRMGVLDPAAFNAALKVFQFPDAEGVLWTVGARSNRWYRWDGGTWQPADPPAQLQIPPMPLELVPDAQRPPLSPAAPAPVQREGPRPQICPTCGAANPGRKFCTKCGARLSSQPL
jgi:hypothetical protein